MSSIRGDLRNVSRRTYADDGDARRKRDQFLLEAERELLDPRGIAHSVLGKSSQS